MASPDDDAAQTASVFYLQIYFVFHQRTLTIGRPPYAHFSFQPAIDARYSFAVAAVVDTNDQAAGAATARSTLNAHDTPPRVSPLFLRRHSHVDRRTARRSDRRRLEPQRSGTHRGHRVESRNRSRPGPAREDQ